MINYQEACYNEEIIVGIKQISLHYALSLFNFFISSAWLYICWQSFAFYACNTIKTDKYLGWCSLWAFINQSKPVSPHCLFCIANMVPWWYLTKMRLNNSLQIWLYLKNPHGMKHTKTKPMVHKTKQAQKQMIFYILGYRHSWKKLI